MPKGGQFISDISMQTSACGLCHCVSGLKSERLKYAPFTLRGPPIHAAGCGHARDLLLQGGNGSSATAAATRACVKSKALHESRLTRDLLHNRGFFWFRFFKRQSTFKQINAFGKNVMYLPNYLCFRGKKSLQPKCQSTYMGLKVSKPLVSKVSPY